MTQHVTNLGIGHKRAPAPPQFTATTVDGYAEHRALETAHEAAATAVGEQNDHVCRCDDPRARKYRGVCKPCYMRAFRRGDYTGPLVRTIAVEESAWITVSQAIINTGLCEIVRIDDQVSNTKPEYGVTSIRIVDGTRTLSKPLTAKEMTVLHGIAAGRSNPQIGKALGIGENTVKSRLQQLYRKLDVSSRSEAVVVAFRTGLLGGRS